MRLLLTNDDGVSAPGLAALYAKVRDLGEVTVVAPDSERSAIEAEAAEQLRLKRQYLGDLNDEITLYFNRLEALNHKEQQIVEQAEGPQQGLRHQVDGGEDVRHRHTRKAAGK